MRLSPSARVVLHIPSADSTPCTRRSPAMTSPFNLPCQADTALAGIVRDRIFAGEHDRRMPQVYAKPGNAWKCVGMTDIRHERSNRIRPGVFPEMRRKHVVICERSAKPQSCAICASGVLVSNSSRVARATLRRMMNRSGASPVEVRKARMKCARLTSAIAANSVRAMSSPR